MALRYSVAARNFMAGIGSFKDAFQNGRLEIYTGAQPASPELAATGTLLCVITNASGAHTPETLSSGSVTLTGGASGSVDSITVGGNDILGQSVPFNTSLGQTAQDVAAQINIYHSAVDYIASASGAVVTIAGIPGSGSYFNGDAVVSTTTTITTTDSNMASGVDPVNGLRFGFAASNTISKHANQVWTGVNLASGTAGWYRFYGSQNDAGGLDSNTRYIREDGAIANSGAQVNMVVTSFTAAATSTVASWDRVLPTS